MLASINLFPVLPLSGLYFEQFKQRQETARLTTWADGRLHRKNIKYCRNHFKYSSVPLFQIAVTQAHLVCQAKICLSPKGNWGFMAVQDLMTTVTQCCSVKLPVGCLFSDGKMGMKAVCKSGMSPFVMKMNLNDWWIHHGILNLSCL